MTHKNFINIEGRTDLKRDPNSKAILSNNKDAFLAYQEKKKQQEELQKIKEEQGFLREELNEIKNLLQILTRGIN